MKLTEQRGNSIQKLLDQRIGPVLLFGLMIALRIKKWLATARKQREPERVLVVCFGAIGDLIVLTEAVRRQWPEKTAFLACSQLNYPCAQMYQDVYAGVAVVNLRSLGSVHKICEQFNITQIYDSTQWANIGPIQAGIAKLLGRDVQTTGFRTGASLRNRVYDKVVHHGADVHEVVNFMNLLAGRQLVMSNAELPLLLPDPYSDKPIHRTGKVLFHLWPSGNRSYLKAWPDDYWIELAKACVEMGYTVYLSGAPADKERTESIVNALGLEKVISLAGTMKLKELSDFVAEEIEFAVSVNTGILHLVVSSGVPVIGLHGGVNPERWGPLGSRSISLLPSSGKSAYLHYGFEYPEDDHEAYVLNRLSIDQVMAAVDRLRAGR